MIARALLVGLLALAACAPVRVHAPARGTTAFPRTWDEPEVAKAAPGAPGAKPELAVPEFVEPEPGAPPAGTLPPLAPAAAPASPVVVVVAPPEPEPEPKEEEENLSPVLRYFKGLAGLELSASTGYARVSTDLNENGASREVANGDASSQTWRLSFWSLPDRTGFVWAPSLGFVSQEIEIADFRQHLTSVSVPDAQTIPTVTSDPNTGLAVDAESPNVYRLSLKTAYLGQRAGYALVSNGSKVRKVLMLQGILNLVEYRDVRYRIGSIDSASDPETKDRSGHWAWVQSGGAVLTGALGFRRPHLALRVEVKYELFRDFRYPKPIEFKGPARFNPEINANERQQLFLDKVSYQTLEIVAGASVFF